MLFARKTRLAATPNGQQIVEWVLQGTIVDPIHLLQFYVWEQTHPFVGLPVPIDLLFIINIDELILA